MGLGFCSAISTVDAASAQMPSPAIKPPDGAALFKQQCRTAGPRGLKQNRGNGATCHSTNLSDVPRQGPPLVQIIGRQAGKVEGFHYSSGLAQAGFTWDEARLDAWLTDPQAVIPGAIMSYRQAKAETRAAIITYLRGLN